MNKTYHIPILETLQKAWQKVYGAKKSFWAALTITILIAYAFIAAEKLFAKYTSIHFGIEVINQIIIFLLELGLIYFGIRRAQNLPVSYQYVFKGFDNEISLKAMLLYLLQILIFLPFPFILIFSAVIISSMLNIFSIRQFNTPTFDMYITMIKQPYIAFVTALILIIMVALVIRLLLAMGFVLDQRFNPFKAIAASFRSTRYNVFRIIAIYICMLFILTVSMIPLGIGLIWTLPMTCILYGEIYQSLRINNQTQP